MEPVAVTCSGACTVTHTVSIDLPPFQLDTEAGAAIASAVLAVWVVGWAFRVLIRTLKHTDGEPSTSESES